MNNFGPPADGFRLPFLWQNGQSHNDLSFDEIQRFQVVVAIFDLDLQPGTEWRLIAFGQ